MFKVLMPTESKKPTRLLKIWLDLYNRKFKLPKNRFLLLKKRNRAEQQSIDALLKGDVSGFIEGQGAAGAASALELAMQN